MGLEEKHRQSPFWTSLPEEPKCVKSCGWTEKKSQEKKSRKKSHGKKVTGNKVTGKKVTIIKDQEKIHISVDKCSRT